MSALAKKFEMISVAAPKRAARLAEVISIARPAEEKEMSAAKRVALFLASPFIGLAYIAAMPLVAAVALAWFGVRALAAKTPLKVKKLGMIAAAPLLGLGFIVALPVAGVTALGYSALKAAEKAYAAGR